MNTENRNNSLTNKPLLRTIELCSGIGAQIKGINKTDLFDTEVIATADLDKEVVVSYAAIHCGLTNEMINNYEDYPSKEEMVEQLTQKRLVMISRKMNLMIGRSCLGRKIKQKVLKSIG